MALSGPGELLLAYEMSALGVAARSTVWLYPLANLIHVLGAAMLFGAIAAFDIAALRHSRAIALIGRATLPVAAIGLVLQLGTGVVLLSAEATTMATNPAFLAKLAAIVVAGANLAAFHWRFSGALAESLLPPAARTHAAVSLAAWTVALLAGRGIAYL